MSSRSQDPEWPCPVCTLLNSDSFTRCAACLTPKPVQHAKIQPKPQPQPIPIEPNPPDEDSGSYIGQFNHYIEPPSPDIGPLRQSTVKRRVTIPKHIVYAPQNKRISEQSIFERWMIAQMERKRGEQPSICTENNVLLTNLRRVRGPTTFETLQKQINEQCDVVSHASNLDAGDFTDDEELSESRHHLNGHHQPFAHTPPSADPDLDEIGTLQTRHRQTNTLSEHELATSFTYNHKKLLNQRRRPKSKKNVPQLWFKAQRELRQGRNPVILAKYNITLTNIRQHNPRFKDFQSRKSDHEKAINYLRVTGEILNVDSQHRTTITKDEDDDEYDDDESYVGTLSSMNGNYAPAYLE